MAAVWAALQQTATVMQTAICLKIAALTFLVTVKSKVLTIIIDIILILLCILIATSLYLEFTEYIMITNKNFIHRIDINETRSRYRLQTPVSGLQNATSLDYHYR